MEAQTENHKELMKFIKPLVDFMNENKYSFFFVAGKDGICTRHMLGNADDITGMISGMMENNNDVKMIIEDCKKK